MSDYISAISVDISLTKDGRILMDAHERDTGRRIDCSSAITTDEIGREIMMFLEIGAVDTDDAGMSRPTEIDLLYDDIAKCPQCYLYVGDPYIYICSEHKQRKRELGLTRAQLSS
jgi:hypothetical protein